MQVIKSKFFGDVFRTTGILVSLFFLKNSIKELWSILEMLRILKKGMVFRPSDLLNALGKSPLDQILTESMIKPKETADSIIFNAFIEGDIVTEASEITEELAKANLAILKVCKSFTYSNDVLNKNKKAKNFFEKLIVLSKIFLQNKENEAVYRCQVKNISKANLELGLRVLKSKSEAKPLGKTKRMIQTLMYIIQTVLNVTKHPIKLKGVQTGIRDSELGIKLGETRTLFGKLVYSKATKELQMIEPQDVFLGKHDFLRTLDRRLLLRLLKIFLLSFLLGVFVALTIRRIYLVIHEYQRKETEKLREEQARKVQGIMDNLGEDFMCVICYTNPKNIILQPCLHLAICDKCWTKVQRQRKVCPMCKRPVSETTNILIK